MSPRANPTATLNASKPNLHAADSSSATKAAAPRTSHSTDETPSVTGIPIVAARSGVQDRGRSDSPVDHGVKDSHAARLRLVLDEPAMRSLFREFLRENFCEENLSFWLDTQDLKRKFNTSSSASVPGSPQKGTLSHQAMEKHQSELHAMALVIYNSKRSGVPSKVPLLGTNSTAYLAPASPCELNIDHSLRAELILHINQMTLFKETKGSDIAANNTTAATQLQTLVKMYERVQAYIYRLMATDSIPKFCKTPKVSTGIV